MKRPSKVGGEVFEWRKRRKKKGAQMNKWKSRGEYHTCNIGFDWKLNRRREEKGKIKEIKSGVVQKSEREKAAESSEKMAVSKD